MGSGKSKANNGGGGEENCRVEMEAASDERIGGRENCSVDMEAASNARIGGGGGGGGGENCKIQPVMKEFGGGGELQSRNGGRQ